MQIKSRFQHYRVSQASTSPSSQDAFYVKFLDTWTVKLTTLDDQLAQIADYNFFFALVFQITIKHQEKIFTLRKHIPSSYPNITVLNKIHPLPPVFFSLFTNNRAAWKITGSSYAVKDKTQNCFSCSIFTNESLNTSETLLKCSYV